MLNDQEPSTEESWEQLIDGFRSGDEQVLQQFYAKYGPLLHKIANNRQSPATHRRFDADDVVQSTFRTFFRRARIGYFQFEDNQRLWNLLCAITLTKLREKLRHHSRQSRSIQREIHPDGESAGDGGAGDGYLMPSADRSAAAVDFADEFENVIGDLSDSERQLIELKLADRTNDEVAEVLGVSDRTVRRMLQRVQGRFEDLLKPD